MKPSQLYPVCLIWKPSEDPVPGTEVCRLQRSTYWACCEVDLCVKLMTSLLTVPISLHCFHNKTQGWTYQPTTTNLAITFLKRVICPSEAYRRFKLGNLPLRRSSSKRENTETQTGRHGQWDKQYKQGIHMVRRCAVEQNFLRLQKYSTSVLYNTEATTHKCLGALKTCLVQLRN